MPSTITSLADRQPASTATAHLFETWFTAVRDRVHGFIQAMIEAAFAKSSGSLRSETNYGPFRRR